jgi:hypothetical protein
MVKDNGRSTDWAGFVMLAACGLRHVVESAGEKPETSPSQESIMGSGRCLGSSCDISHLARWQKLSGSQALVRRVTTYLVHSDSTENRCSILIVSYSSDGKKINSFPIEVGVLGVRCRTKMLFGGFACSPSADTSSLTLSLS